MCMILTCCASESVVATRTWISRWPNLTWLCFMTQCSLTARLSSRSSTTYGSNWTWETYKSEPSGTSCLLADLLALKTAPF